MLFRSYVSSAVIGLAAVSLAAPLLGERGIVTIGKGQNNGEPDTPNPTTGTAASTTTAATSTIPTPTMDNGQWHKQMNAKPDDGMYNATKYDNSDQFDDGKYHPNKVASATGAETTLDPTSTPVPIVDPSSQSTGNGTQVSGGISIGLPDGDHEKKPGDGEHGQRGDHCWFHIFCV